MTLHGQQLIGYGLSAENNDTFQSHDLTSGEDLPTSFHEATLAEIDQAMALASKAFATYRKTTPEQRAAFLEAIAEEIEALGDDLLELTNAETALGIPRLTGERARACNGARMFAAMIREGSWVDARIETAIPDRAPLPKPDIRLMHRPVGPVVVFGASNFPLAISVAGTDTVSALGAGCPVVVKAHPAHPGTCEMIGTALLRAAKRCELPEGVFSMVQGRTNEVGTALVKHDKTEAVAFTGSLRGGRALFDIANSRPRPIPLYAEMGSQNPVFILPGALKERGPALAEGYVGSLTLGVGQFCTNPGLVLGFGGEELQSFVKLTADRVNAIPPATMLHQGIHQAYVDGVARLKGVPGMTVAGETATSIPSETMASAVVMQTGIDTFFANEEVMTEEVFGPASVVLECQSPEQMAKFAEGMDCSLSATVHGTDEDLAAYSELISILETRAGRVVINGFPTGLEPCTAMHHGGPYPAATHGFFTSVGTNSIYRFVRPVSFQGYPQAVLPEELQDSNPRGIWRMINGEWTNGGVSV